MADGGTTPAALEAVAVKVAVGAARFVRDGRPTRVDVAATKSTDLDVVTAMDTASEQLILDRLAALRPDDAVLGEEGGGRTGRTGLTWVVDPIDGTVNYLYGLPMYAVSVAVVTGDPNRPGAWEPLAGAVVNPEVGEVFHASRGGGAWRRPLVGGLGEAGEVGVAGEPVRLAATDTPDLERALLATGFSYDRSARDEQGRVAHRVLERVRDLRRMGSAALDLCSVAAGRVDGYYESGLHAWDLAAGWLVATEAGAVVTSVDGGSAGGGSVLAAGPSLHPLLRDLLVALRRA